MLNERMLLQRRVKRRRRSPDEESGIHRPPDHNLASLQRQIGNRAVQRLLAQQRSGGYFVPPLQRQAEAEGPQPQDEAEAAKQPVGMGQVKIEKPQIEFYDVTGTTLDEVISQVESEEESRQFEYQYEPKIENGLVTQVDVTVRVTLRLPRWIGPGWDQAPEPVRAEWAKVLKSFQVYEDEEEAETALPQEWLLGPAWEGAPEQLRNSWRGMLQMLQNEEENMLDLIRRRVLVLQKRLLQQPENQVKTIFAQFLEAMEAEEEQYLKQRELGQPQEISISLDLLVQ